MTSKLVFTMNSIGYGHLTLYDDFDQILIYDVRTGSVNTQGLLVHSIPVKDWYILTPSVETKEVGMVYTLGKGWKIRLYTVPDKVKGYSRYLIHPDGNKPGSNGCVVTRNTDAIDLKNAIDSRLKKQGSMEMHITKNEGVV
jgi:hypothetical protein